MEEENNILFQKVGSLWYLFTRIDDDIFYTPLPKGMGPKTAELTLYEVVDGAKMEREEKLDLAS